MAIVGFAAGTAVMFGMRGLTDRLDARPHTASGRRLPVGFAVVPAGPSVAECDAKLARYRAALDAGADPAVVAGWIADTQAKRQRAERCCQPAARPNAEAMDALTTEQIIAIVEELGDMIAVLKEADPEHKVQVYRNLGLQLTYHLDTQTVRAQIDLGTHRWDSVCIRGSTGTDAQTGIWLAETLALK